jgi:putative membrane protein
VPYDLEALCFTWRYYGLPCLHRLAWPQEQGLLVSYCLRFFSGSLVNQWSFFIGKNIWLYYDYVKAVKSPMKLILNWILSALVLIITARFVEGFTIASFGTALIAAALLGLVNILIRPLVLLLTLPINILTLGLFTLIVNGLMLWIVASIVKGVTLSGFGPAILAAIVLWVLNLLIGWIINGQERTSASQE